MLDTNIWSRNWWWGHARSLQVHLEVRQANNPNHFLWTWQAQYAARNRSHNMLLYKSQPFNCAQNQLHSQSITWCEILLSFQISLSPRIDLQRACGLCIPRALPSLGSKLRCTNTGGEQSPFCNSGTSAPLPGLYPQTAAFLFWSLNGVNEQCPLRFAYRLSETSSECCDSFPHCSKPRGTEKLLPPVLSFY